MEIGAFQLQNLLNNQVGFLFYLIGETAAQERSSLLRSAEVVATEADALIRIKEKAQDPSQPVVLICPTGEQSSQVVEALEQEGFLNACWVEGGLAALEDEGYFNQ